MVDFPLLVPSLLSARPLLAPWRFEREDDCLLPLLLAQDPVFLLCRVRRKLSSSGDLDGKDFLRLPPVLDSPNTDVWAFFPGVRLFDAVFVTLFKSTITDFVSGLLLFLSSLLLVFCFLPILFGQLFLETLSWSLLVFLSFVVRYSLYHRCVRIGT